MFSKLNISHEFLLYISGAILLIAVGTASIGAGRVPHSELLGKLVAYIVLWLIFPRL